ncbi:MAG: DUF4292 domain-containing protein [Desulfobacterales bacterium]|nr:DUF4292 domain-containing protein [Desulfobacterales bacterium]
MILIFFAVAFFAGCSSITARLPDRAPDARDTPTAADAQMVLSILRNQNQSLQSFKGIGKIKVRYKQKLKFDERIAWIGSENANLRIELLVSGQSAVKMSTDGKWFYYYEARQGEPLYKKDPATDASLKRIVAIPIKVSDIVHLLAGRVPLREHGSAKLIRQDSANSYVLALKRKWAGVTEKIFLDESKSRVHQIEFYHHTGSLVYRVLFEEMQNIDGYQVPAKLRILNDDGADFHLIVERYWTNINVSPSMFVLNPPK